MSVKNRYKDLSVRRKILFIYIPLSLLPLIVFALFSRNIYENSIIDRTLKTAEDQSQLIIQQVESVMSDASDAATMLTLGINDIYEESLQTTKPLSLYLYTNITNELTYTTLVFPNVESIVYVDVEGRLYGTHSELETYRDALSSPLIETLDKTTGTDYWYPMTYRDYLVTDASVPVMSLGKKIINIKNGLTLGYLIVNISEPELAKRFTDQVLDFMIISPEHHIMVTRNKEKLLTNFSADPLFEIIASRSSVLEVNQNKNTPKMVIAKVPSDSFGWYLVGKANLLDLTEDLDSINTIILFLLFLMLLIITASMNYISNIITRPIRSLTEAMQKVAGGDFNVAHTYDSKDEIGTLSRGFNHMSREIRDLLVRVESEQKQKREYELALIQEQIKPHFLYNCLDAIYALAMMNRVKDAAKTTKSLADYYRLSLANGREIISLSEEFANIYNYLELQKIRYSDVFDYDLDLMPGLIHQKILKLTLQPLVENAIYHGLKPSEKKGFLQVTSRRHEDHIYITVKDNGVGIPEEVQRTLLTEASSKQHYGMYNVQDRLKLFFGNAYGLTIRSVYGEGTEVTVHLPYAQEDDNDKTDDR